MASVSKQAVERPNYDIIEFIMSFFLNRTSEIGSLVMIKIFFSLRLCVSKQAKVPIIELLHFLSNATIILFKFWPLGHPAIMILKSKNSSLKILRLIEQAFELIFTFSDNWKLQLRIGTFE